MNSQLNRLKAIIYCRVSSKEQEDSGYSLEAQEKLLEGYAKNKFTIIGQPYKIAESASGKQIRRKFNEMMVYVKKNNVSIILCEKIDRLTRNLKDASVIYEWLYEDENRAVHCVKENFIANKNTKAHENLVWDMKVAIAKFYSQNLSEEVKKGQQEKLAQGWIPTRPPMGYKTIGEAGHKIHVIDEAIAPYIKQMFEWYATGNYSLNRLEMELYKGGLRTRTYTKEVDGKKTIKGGKRLRRSKIHTMLQDPFFYGQIHWLDKIYGGKQEPIISKELFDKVQTILRRKTKNPKYQKHFPLFRGKIFCEGCGGMVTWYTKKGHWYGHCNNSDAFKNCPKKTCIREDRIEPQITGVFDIIAPKDERILAAVENILRTQHQEKVMERENEIKRIEGLLQNVRKQKDRYYEAKINREVDFDYCDRKLKELTTDEDALEASLVTAGDNNDLSLQIGIAVHELAYKSHEIYQNADVDAKRLLFSKLFTNLLQNGLEIRKEYTKAAAILVEWMPKLNNDYELSNSRTNKAKDAVLATSSTSWLRGLDSNQDIQLQRLLSYH